MKNPFGELIGLNIARQDAGFSELNLTITPDLLNPHQVAHGAVLYALADTGMGAALYPSLAEGELCATIEIKMNYFAPVFSGDVVCQTRLVHRGKKIAHLESELTLDGKLVAKASGNYAIFKPSGNRS
ncbi:PaaI family thioesterase [Litorivivens sp.]|uniref:PaaI family thioesterase n=1 Tax=Litorivivens sp. TaxID=2020868 RepID=UPI003566A8EA